MRTRFSSRVATQWRLPTADAVAERRHAATSYSQLPLRPRRALLGKTHVLHQFDESWFRPQIIEPRFDLQKDVETLVNAYDDSAGVTAAFNMNVLKRINSELGGNVGGGYVRWNFFTDTTVTVNGDVWVEAGRLVR